jgi:hypothetical protein
MTQIKMNPPVLDSGQEVANDQYVRIDWPDGSLIQGTLHISEHGYTTLRFGPEEEPRWIVIATASTWLPFVARGSVSLVAS